MLQVSTSEHIDAKHILLMLPSGSLPELRVLLLEKMGQHLEALRSHFFRLRLIDLFSCSFTPLRPLHDYDTGFVVTVLMYLVFCILQSQNPCRLYVHTMNSPRLAEAYCDRMYEALLQQDGQHKRVLWGSHTESPSYDMYLALIRVHTVA